MGRRHLGTELEGELPRGRTGLASLAHLGDREEICLGRVRWMDVNLATLFYVSFPAVLVQVHPASFLPLAALRLQRATG